MKKSVKKSWKKNAPKHSMKGKSSYNSAVRFKTKGGRGKVKP